MARKQQKQDTADAVIEEFESIAERGAEWIGNHFILAASLVVLSLGLAAAYAGYHSWHGNREAGASAALDRVQSEYLEAMGVGPGTLEPPELANPDAAKRIKQEFSGRFAAVASEHRGTVPGTLAALAQGNLIEEQSRQANEATGVEPQTIPNPMSEDPNPMSKKSGSAAIEIWIEALDTAPRNGRLRAILWERIAQSHEESSRWLEAAEAHEQAGRITSFPLRYRALADAARCYIEADQLENARALSDRVADEAPSIRLPEHIRSQRRELVALGSL